MARVPLLPDFPRPLLWAHRGLSSRAPENSMAAFALARSEGIPGLELDVQCCKTGELVVFHDETLERICGAAGTVRGTSLQDLCRFDIASGFGERFGESFGPSPGNSQGGRQDGPSAASFQGGPSATSFHGEKIPLFDEVLEAFGDDCYLDIEIKTSRLDGGGVPEALVGALRRHGKRTRAGSISISSFNPLALARFKRLAPQYPAALIWADDESIPRYLRRGQGRLALRCDYLKPQAALAGRLASRSRIPVVAWTVDEPASAAALLGAGCAGLVSNRPERVREGFPLIRA